MKAILPVI
ncbi:unnamed protein product, partial [Rotaria sordida]